MNISDMVTSSVLARMMAIIILSLVMMAAIIIASYDLIIGRAVPDIINSIVGIGIGTAGTLIGVNFGVVLQPLGGTSNGKPAANP